MRILLTGACNFTEEQMQKIKEMGFDIDFLQNEKDEVDGSLYDGVVCNGLFLHHPIEKFENLKLIQLTSAGYDRVPMDYCRENDIKVFNAKGVYSIPMAEYAITGVLNLYRHTRFFMENQKNRKWEKHRNLLELSGKTVCIIGCGNVGCECAKRFKAFGCMIIGVDISEGERESFGKVYGLSDIEKALEKADVIVISLPLTSKTYHLFDSKIFSYIKDGAVLVNISRGAVVDASALISALKSEKLSGAVLDVFENEPLDDNASFWNMDNVIVTPHNSFVGEGNTARLYDLINYNLKKWRQK